MNWITTNGTLHCAHGGRVDMKPSQHLVRIQGHEVFVARDPEGRPIGGCPIVSPKPCSQTLQVLTGYSSFLRIDGHRVCLSTVKGITDVAPPAPYYVTGSGQHFVRANR
jgi:hypothetical protein